MFPEENCDDPINVAPCKTKLTKKIKLGALSPLPQIELTIIL
jgi:hypothetical protein